VFDKLIWQSDRMLLNDLVFRLEHYRSDGWDGGDHFRFWKIKELVDQYQAFFSLRPSYCPLRLLELGIYDGGSIVFWNEILHPQKYLAVDILERTDSPYFRHYLESRGLGERIRTFWETDQADKGQLRALVETELDGRIDMVIDDASHLYDPTRASFEALFPLCVPGGLYIIEDWAWDHWKEFSSPDHPWAGQTRLTQLVIELIEATGTSTELISNIAVYQGFVAIERGPHQFVNPGEFDLKNHIVRRPVSSLRSNRFARARYTLRRKLSRIVKRFISNSSRA
jgi:cephalosporin hydroxylase